MSDRYHTPTGSVLPLHRDRLLASCAALTLALSWYFAAALDHYVGANRATQPHRSDAFDAAFIAANQEPVAHLECESDTCTQRLAASDSLHAQL